MDLRYFEFSYLPFKDEVSGRAVSSLVAAPFPSDEGTLDALPRGCGNGGDEKSVEKREIQNDPNIIYPYSSIFNIEYCSVV